MPNFVVKRDGTKEAFDPEKVKASVVAAASEAGLSQDESSSLAKNILDSVSVGFEGREEVATSEIREKILSELDVTSPSVSEAWRKYDESRSK